MLKTAKAFEENKPLLADYFSPNQIGAPKSERRRAVEESEISHQVMHPQSESHPQGSGGTCGARQRGRRNKEPRTVPPKRSTLLEMVRNMPILHTHYFCLSIIS